jgi:acetylornithine deacetylase
LSSIQPSSNTPAMLAQLLAINTVSRNSNLGLIEFARDTLAGVGASCRLTYDSTRGKANLLATLGDRRPGGLVLSAHTDTVPTDEQAWTVEPFAATRRDGKTFGRGSCDMKGFIACVLNAAPALAASNKAFHIALSYDEEVGCFGAKELIADLRDAGYAPKGCIIGEPTDMVPAIAHKGVYRWRCCVRGKEAHSSLTPSAVNAIEYAAKLIHRLRTMAEELAANESPWQGFDVPFTTASVGVIKGGIADNVVPRDCEFNFEFRNLPNRDAQALFAELQAYAASLTPEMRAIAADAGFRFEEICAVPGFLGSADSKVTQLAQLLSKSKKTTLVAFGTEAGLFSGAGIPTVVCGPGSITQAHQPDEFVSNAQLSQCEEFLARLASESYEL